MDENWLFTARIPFTDATRSERGQPDANISGLGDVSITAIYSPWASDDSPWSPLSFSAGFIFPTGEARENPRIGGVNPSVFQLGTGTTQFTLSASYFGEINEDWSYFTSANFTLPLYESSKDFRPAETFFFRAGMGHSFTDSLTAKLSLDLFHGERDEFLGNEIGDTGSTTLSLAPSLVYSINENLSASASVAIPVYRRVNETALAVGPLWSLGLSYSF
jgi:hypothetical protein